jgi:hypothetical protein
MTNSVIARQYCLCTSVVPCAALQLLCYKSAEQFQRMNPETRRTVLKKAYAEVSEMVSTVLHYSLQVMCTCMLQSSV